MRKEFFYRYSKFGIEPAVPRDIYRFTTDDESAGSSQKVEEADKRQMTLIYYDPFWEELKKCIEFAAVYDRRHSDFYIYQLQHPLKYSSENFG